MPTLLVSLGTSWAIVPEAFHLLPPGPSGFSAVHVLTTASPKIDRGIECVRQWFSHHHPTVALTITRVDGFVDLRSEDDHFTFEEVLYRWVLASAPEPSTRYVCLAGGFKTMSAAMQKAAAVLGAHEVFHVLAEPGYPTDTPGQLREARTEEEIADSLARGAIRHLRLGREGGWPQLRAAWASNYPLVTVQSDGPERYVRAADQRFRSRLRELVDRSHRIAENWIDVAHLPFAELATWPPAELAWLREPLQPTSQADAHWVAALPKIELHCHLGGFATHGPELAAIRAAAWSPSALPALAERHPLPDWPTPAKPIGLELYRHLGDNNGSALLRDPGCLRAQCEALYAHFVSQNILYAEVRCSPANYASPGRSPWQVLTEIRDHFQACMTADAAARAGVTPCCHVNLLIIGTRQTGGDYRAGIALHLALALSAAEHWTDDTTCRVVGVDLAGFEDASTRAHYFREEFVGVHRCGLALTVHAGETDDVEGVWRAVFDLNARRLGHALALAQSPALLRSVADRSVAVEMCPYANLQIKGFALDGDVSTAKATHRYPLLDYLRAGVRVTVNTDNIGISAASLTDNLLLAARLCPGLTRLDVLRLQRHAVDSAFIPAALRERLIARASSTIRHP